MQNENFESIGSMNIGKVRSNVNGRCTGCGANVKDKHRFCWRCGAILVPEEQDKVYIDLGEVSDGYHTFDELYEHRTVLLAALVNMIHSKVEGDELKTFKSWKHHDGTMYDGMFIVGIWTKQGWITYHCCEKFWDYFGCQEIEHAPEWDGHTSQVVLSRLAEEFCS